MGIFKVKQFAAILGVVVFLLLVVFSLSHRAAKSPLGQINYNNSISGTSGTFFANKGLEVSATRPIFINSDPLSNLLGDSKFNDTLTALTQFANIQSHYKSRNPIITNVQQTGLNTTFILFLDTSEQFYDVNLTFTNQQQPVLTYKVDTNAKT